MSDPNPSPNLEQRFSAALLRIRSRSPFFATLALFARFRPSREVVTAATDGRDVYYNPAFMSRLPEREFEGVLLHEVLHAAHLHVTRRSLRNPQLWNIAADIVVNGILRDHGFELPQGALFDSALERYSVEEVYALLLKHSQKYELPGLDLLEAAPADVGEDERESYGQPGNPRRSRARGLGDDSMSEARKNRLEAHWARANQQAATLARGLHKGDAPAGLERLLAAASPPRLDWRAVLWRFLTATPTDFEGFDRRYIGRGLYLDALQGHKLRLYLAVDTSGSVDDAQVRAFLAEVQGILRAYPQLECWLYYADAAVYGPYVLGPGDPIPTPRGGGGTDFRPFFQAVREAHEDYLGGVCVYLTDGYGDFPAEPPELPVLWAITPGGLDLEHLPFGEGVRLVG
ncbi:DUF2201 family putative metallopeptidase [Calidithermus roseus]|uniref:Putative metallopeptidase domain protein n=1 Tax=Calidithermus roseus TaxID=1644118 RepID=A0A399EHT6_9DEIN|nr:VWA-like domain-containing protein [Calidithermus roseus]RIH83256.1 putative metallopeptidase domain protein [Calidithermus roseus]